MDLMTKHLSSLPTGSAIELCYGFMDSQNQPVPYATLLTLEHCI